MRNVIAASLALFFPVLVHAQTNSSAQPQAPNTLQSKLAAPAVFGAAASSTPSGLRVSTGVVAPKLISTVDIISDRSAAYETPTNDRKIVLSMIVDKDGKPTDLKVVQSVNPVMDHNVLVAVKQYRFRPATVDNQPVASAHNLEIVIHTPVQ
jgi:TonB family protein